MGLNRWGSTVVDASGAIIAAEVFSSYARLFAVGPEELRLTGSFSWADEPLPMSALVHALRTSTSCPAFLQYVATECGLERDEETSVEAPLKRAVPTDRCSAATIAAPEPSASPQEDHHEACVCPHADAFGYIAFDPAEKGGGEPCFRAEVGNVGVHVRHAKREPNEWIRLAGRPPGDHTRLKVLDRRAVRLGAATHPEEASLR